MFLKKYTHTQGNGTLIAMPRRRGCEESCNYAAVSYYVIEANGDAYLQVHPHIVKLSNELLP